jgi:hypothetical protein
MYTITKDGEWYSIAKNGKPLLTPMNRPVKTVFKTLADRLLSDLKKHGENPSDPTSLVAFHYAMTDFFSAMPRTELEHTVAIGLNQDNDWTFNCPTAAPEPMMEWITLFGTHSSNADIGKKWLSSLSLMQLCAVCVIGRALESVNIPFIVATKLSPNTVKTYAKKIDGYYPYVGMKDLMKFFDNFFFYFTIEKES